MTRNSINNTLLCLALGATAVHAQVAVDFNTSGDLTGNFAGFSDFAEQAAGGIDDSGAVTLSNNSQIAVYQSTVDLVAGTGHSLSMYFQYNGGEDGDGNTGRGFFVGYTSGADDTYETSATSTGVDIRGIVAGDGSGNLYGLDLQNDGENVDASSKNVELTVGEWYLLELTIGETEPGAFVGVTVTLYEASSDGTVGSALKVLDNGGSGGYTVTSSLADAGDVYPFFGGQNPLRRAASVADNFVYLSDPVQPTTHILRGAPLTVDGVIDGGWAVHPQNDLTVDIDGSAPEAADLSGYWKAVWDDEYLYFLIVTNDDTVVDWPGSSFWNYDMTELFLDMDYSRNDDVVRYDENDFQTVFPRDGSAVFANGDSPLSLPLEQFAQTSADGTTVIEVALPWSDLTVMPAHGMPIGVDVYMKDNDTGEASRDAQIAWSPSNDEAWKNPSLFGTAILMDETATPVTDILQGSPETVDGIIEARWDFVPENRLSVDIDGTDPAEENLSGYWKALWDEENLYLLLVTNDETVVTWPGNQFWNYDMTELFLDMDYSRNDGDERYDENDFQTVFPRDGQDVFANGDSPLTFPLEQIGQVTTDGTTVVEVALPWSELTVSPEVGMPIGIDVYMKDNDSGEASRDNQISWSPSQDLAWRNPSLFGTAVLSAETAPSSEVYFGTPVLVDGIIDSVWNPQPTNALTVDIDDTEPTEDDLSGYWKAVWDDEYLYFLIVTNDDTIVDWPGSQFWNYDMTELFLDMDNSRNDGDERYDENDFQTVFPRDGQDVFANGDSPLSFPLERVGQVSVDGTTVIEVALPWSELTVNPEHGHIFGVDVYMKDNDSGEASREAQIAWSPSQDLAWRNPSLFGSAVLVGNSVTPVTEIPEGTPETVDAVVEAGWDEIPANYLGVDIDGTMPLVTDLSGYWKAMWDETNLYFLIITHDDTIVDWPGSQFWNYDMTELFLDMDYSRRDGVDRYDENDFQTVFPRDGGDVFFNGDSPVSLPLSQFAMISADGTTVIEVAFPWSELTVTPAVGKRIGVDVYMKDNDTGEGARDAQISWSPSQDLAWRNPSLFGTAILTGDVEPGDFVDLIDAQLQPDGSYRSSWFGAFTVQGDWVNHSELSWLYTGYVSSTDSMWLWSDTLQSYLWSSSEVFPIVYQLSESRWVYFFSAEGTGTLVYDYSTGSWTPLGG